MIKTILAQTAAITILAASARAQYDLPWWSVDCGGGISTGGSFSLFGTIGQADAGTSSGGNFTINGGFWQVGVAPGCYPNCDDSTTPPILNVQDFACFLNKFASADPYANCDASTTAPTLNVQDFACFLNKFAAGCP